MGVLVSLLFRKKATPNSDEPPRSPTIHPDHHGRLSAAGDPYVTIAQEGVGELVKLAAERGRTARNSIKLGICGGHGGDPGSIHFCQSVGLDYISCSPYR